LRRDLDLTMLHHMSRRGRVDAMLKDGLTSGDSSSGGLAQILQPKEASVDYAPSPVSPGEVAAILKNAPDLPLSTTMPSSSIYNLLDDSIAISIKSPSPKCTYPSPRAERPLQMRRGDCTLVVKDCMRGTVHSRSTTPLTRIQNRIY